MYLGVALTKSVNPTPQDLEKIAVDSIGDSLLLQCLASIKPIYENLGATDQVAKGTELVEKLKFVFQSSE